MRDISSQILVNATAKVDFIHSDEIVSSCAFEVGEGCEIRLRVSRSLAVLSSEIHVFDEYICDTGIRAMGVWQGIDRDLDEFVFDLSILSDRPTLRFFYIRLVTSRGDLFVKKYGSEFITGDGSARDVFQLSFSKFEYPMPEKALGGVIYHVFVDRFRRGGDVPVSEGAVLVSGEWENIPEYPEYPGAPLKNNTFYGGTLYGIVEKLDYIKSLGTTVLYLSPIFSSVSNHKYDTADYMTVDEMFGGEDALRLLIKEAADRGISIILDGVFNHTGDDSIYFNKRSRFDSLGAYNSKESPYYSWYDFKEYPDKYTCWWDIPILPRIKPDISECGEFIAGKGGVVEKYAEMGVYGFRLDVADELSDDFIARIKARLSECGESLLLGEVWEDASCKVAYGTRKKYYLGRELDGVMNYPVRVGLIDYILTRNTDKLSYALREVMSNTPPRIRNTQMNLLGSHDTVRILTALAGRTSEGCTNAELRVDRLTSEENALASERLISAYTILATLPGLPSVFYGDEAGLEGYGDPFCRMPYPWGKENEKILDRYRRLGAIRLSAKAYRDGDFELNELTNGRLIFTRSDDRFSYITIFNNSERSVKLKFSCFAYDMVRQSRCKRVDLLGYGSTVLRIKSETVFEIISEET